MSGADLAVTANWVEVHLSRHLGFQPTGDTIRKRKRRQLVEVTRKPTTISREGPNHEQHPNILFNTVRLLKVILSETIREIITRRRTGLRRFEPMLSSTARRQRRQLCRAQSGKGP